MYTIPYNNQGDLSILVLIVFAALLLLLSHKKEEMKKLFCLYSSFFWEIYFSLKIYFLKFDKIEKMMKRKAHKPQTVSLEILGNEKFYPKVM